MKNNTLLMVGIAAAAIYYFYSRQSGREELSVSGALPYGGYIEAGIPYMYDEHGQVHPLQ